MRVCQTCGSIGYSQALVVCDKCHIITEHAYCLDKSELTEEGEVKWTCEFCEPRIGDLSDSTGSVEDNTEQPELIEESRRIRDNCEVGPPINELQLFNRDSENCHKTTEHTRVLVEDLHLPSEALETKRTQVEYASSPENLSTSQEKVRNTIEPLPDPIWMGNFQIYGGYSCTIQGLMAHLSNEACKEATKVASTLPVLLHLEMVPKVQIWPIKFKNVEPSVENIAVYFFPEDDRTERIYDCLVDDMIEQEFAKYIFSSCELPEDDRRFRRKHYLWGMFRRKRKKLYSEPK